MVLAPLEAGYPSQLSHEGLPFSRIFKYFLGSLLVKFGVDVFKSAATAASLNLGFAGETSHPRRPHAELSSVGPPAFWSSGRLRLQPT